MFFPFDPYLMDESRAFIDPIYETWKYGDEDDEEDEEDFDSDTEDPSSISGSMGEMHISGTSLDYRRFARSHSDQKGQVRPRSVSGMGHTPNSRSFVSHSPGFEPAKIGPYKKRRQTNVDNSLDELSPHDYSGALNSI